MRSEKKPGESLVRSHLENHSIFFPERTVPLHAMLVNCGHQLIREHSYCWDGMKRGSRELAIWQYTLRGRGALRQPDRVVPLTPGRAMLVLVPDDHCYYLPEDSDCWEVLFVTLYGREAIRLVREAISRQGAVLEHDGSESETVLLAWQIFNLCEQGSLNDKFRSSKLAYEFALTLLGELEQSDTYRESRPAFLAQVTQYCLEHLEEAVTVDELAALAGYSRYHFSRQFRRYQGMSPQQYVTELRLKLALRMLQTEPLSIKEIAARCGFEDVSYFCKVFKKHQLVSPDRFRNRR